MPSRRFYSIMVYCCTKKIVIVHTLTYAKIGPWKKLPFTMHKYSRCFDRGFAPTREIDTGYSR